MENKNKSRLLRLELKENSNKAKIMQQFKPIVQGSHLILQDITLLSTENANAPKSFTQIDRILNLRALVDELNTGKTFNGKLLDGYFFKQLTQHRVLT